MNIYSQICNPANLNLAYAQIRTRVIKPTFDQLAVANYENHLELNLDDLARRLRKGLYYPVSMRIFESADNSLSQTTRIIEDQIVQHAAFNAIAPLFEPTFVDCSFGPHRNTEAHVAVRQVLEHRAKGDNYIVRADISEEISRFDHDNLIYLLGTQINDQRMLRLIRMWLNCGQALPRTVKIDYKNHFSSNGRSSALANSAFVDLPEKDGHDRWDDADDWGFGEDRNPQDFRSALKRLGIDAARITIESSLLALASNPRYRHIFTKRNIAFAAAAALTAAAYPAASQLLLESLSPGRCRRIRRSSVALSCPPAGTLTGPLAGSLAGLMADVALHRFDVAMTGLGWRMVRYYDRFAITASREADAHFALEQAVRELHQMDIHLTPQNVGVARFEEGVEFLGYRIYEYENAAELIRPYEQTQLDHWSQQVTDVIRQPQTQLTLAATQIGRLAKDRLKAGVRQLRSLLYCDRKHGR